MKKACDCAYISANFNIPGLAKAMLVIKKRPKTNKSCEFILFFLIWISSASSFVQHCLLSSNESIRVLLVKTSLFLYSNVVATVTLSLSLHHKEIKKLQVF